MATGLVVDPGSTELDLFAYPFRVTAFRTPTPAMDPRFAQPADADGDRLAAVRFLNREIAISVEIKPFREANKAARAAVGQAALAQLADKIARINREGVALVATLETGDEITFDLLLADAIDPPRDLDWDLLQVERAELRFTAMPYWRGREVSYTAAREATNPAIVFTVAAPEGDVPALGRLVLTDDQGADQLWSVWGVQSRYYDSAASAALFYTASTRTSFSGALANGTYKAILSTQASGGGAHMTHVGQYRVFSRIQRGSGTGDLSIAFDWAVGDMLSYSRNPTVIYPAGDGSSSVRIFDLGVITVPPMVGTQRWEGRIVARSTVSGDTAPIPRDLWLVPVDEGSGELTANPHSSVPTTFSALDDFGQTAGALSGKSLVVGGTWTGAGTSSTDFQASGSGAAVRTATGDATTNIASGRIAVASTPTSLTATSLRLQTTVTPLEFVLTGMVARYVDSRNFLAVYVLNGVQIAGLYILKRVAGVDTLRASAGLGETKPATVTTSAEIGANGVVQVMCVGRGTGADSVVELGTYDADLATGGVLAAGTVGIVDRYSGATANTRFFNDLAVWVPLATDAAIYARQSAEIRHDGVVRQDPTGAVWGSVPYEGDLLTVPPAGPEGRSVRVIAKSSRVVPGTGADPAVDDISAQLHVTPRGLIVPA